MKKVVQRSNDRGHADYGWLKTKYSFSFADYYNPKRTGFGKLLVLNDDIISPKRGFGKHGHKDMEIITIVFKGELTHEDSTGSIGKIGSGEIQVMSAGTGILHSEMNNSDETVELFQIWIRPDKLRVKPGYETKSFDLKENELNLVVGNQENDNLFINQDAKIYLVKLNKEKLISYNLKKNKGIFLIVKSGNIKIKQENLKEKDSIEIWDISEVEIESLEDSEFVLIEVPLN